MQTDEFELTAVDREILAIARKHPTWSGLLDALVRERLGMTSAAFYQRLTYLSRQRVAIEHDPMTTRMVREWRRR